MPRYLVDFRTLDAVAHLAFARTQNTGGISGILKISYAAYLYMLRYFLFICKRGKHEKNIVCKSDGLDSKFIYI